MPTRGRIDMVRTALRCFESQTYPNKELVIFDDSKEPSFPDGISGPGIVYERDTQSLNIPQKRNKCCAMARGEIIQHWDSDDWYAPERMADQVKRLEESGMPVTGYKSILFWSDQGIAARYTGDATSALGTSLCYRKTWWAKHPFNERVPKGIGEDNHFVRQARDHILSVDGGGLIVARVHGGNTSPKNIRGPQYVNYSPVEKSTLPAAFLSAAGALT